MKQIKLFILIFIALVIILAIFIPIFHVSSATDSNMLSKKVLSEIRYFENSFVNMFNTINNITYENYKLSIDDSSDKTKKFDLNKISVLSNKEDIDWKYLGQEAELLETSLSTLTLDLYEISLNTIDILNFNKEYDTLLIGIKNKDKTATLASLSSLYSYLVKFTKNCNQNEEYEVLINTKLNILNAYAMLDTEDWNSITKYVQMANNIFSKFLTNVDLNSKNQYIINKCYVSLNNLQNAIELHDKQIFLIKYKNLLEDLSNI